MLTKHSDVSTSLHKAYVRFFLDWSRSSSQVSGTEERRRKESRVTLPRTHSHTVHSDSKLSPCSEEFRRASYNQTQPKIRERFTCIISKFSLALLFPISKKRPGHDHLIITNARRRCLFIIYSRLFSVFRSIFIQINLFCFLPGLGRTCTASRRLLLFV